MQTGLLQRSRKVNYETQKWLTELIEHFYLEGKANSTFTSLVFKEKFFMEAEQQ